MTAGCTYGWMHRNIMLVLHTLAMIGSDVASLVEFQPVVWEEIARQTNRQMMDAQTDAQKK